MFKLSLKLTSQREIESDGCAGVLHGATRAEYWMQAQLDHEIRRDGRLKVFLHKQWKLII